MLVCHVLLGVRAFSAWGPCIAFSFFFPSCGEFNNSLAVMILTNNIATVHLIILFALLPCMEINVLSIIYVSMDHLAHTIELPEMFYQTFFFTVPSNSRLLHSVSLVLRVDKVLMYNMVTFEQTMHQICAYLFVSGFVVFKRVNSTHFVSWERFFVTSTGL